ncbi:filamentous hemagglutinin N-terminal domain-containing protein, partial [Neisseria meningitidis]|nr:filamentous hemagglutinin N-terminal domain-containing protein [Neisseria meningitidis]
MFQTQRHRYRRRPKGRRDIANPNGITVNGGGFKNVGRGILTTGAPQIGKDG